MYSNLMGVPKVRHKEYSKGYKCCVCGSPIPNEYSVKTTVFIKSKTFGPRFYDLECFRERVAEVNR